ncbi:MAG: sel1 repeat family protein [Campylobacteraceae bacterium]|nr:sel1 repeat family protein [Campylobacteraceae bacterium]
MSADDFNKAFKAYENGDYQKAVKLFQQSCDKKDTWSCVSLAAMYANGDGVKQDYAKAAEYFEKACDLGEQMGCENYKRLKK